MPILGQMIVSHRFSAVAWHRSGFLPKLGSRLRPALIVVLGLLVGWLVVAVTVDRVFAVRSASLALLFNPGSADANVRVAEELARDGLNAAATASIAAHATRALERQPLSPGAARSLGYVVAARGREAQGEALARYAETMSRRDLGTQVWLIETEVQRGNINRALIHYDRAMRTSVQGRELLFPILTAAADDPAIWQPLSRFLEQRPQWWRAFVDQFVPASSSPAALYAIARRSGVVTPGRGDLALAQAIEKRLVDLKAYGAAVDLYNRAHGLPADNAGLLRNGDFERPGGWDPFDWNLFDEPDFSAVRQPSPSPAGGNALFLTTANGRGGDLATQLIMLRPGNYAMTATMGNVGGDPLAYPHFIVRCAADSRELLNARFPTAPEAGRSWRGLFTVPIGCPAQRLVVNAISSLDPSVTVPWVDKIAIHPEGR
ncbi:hypothetical protein HRV97_16760 [Sphingomonas sp. HHU CXW]|uniref:Tetratricopeptide repeat protein n=1 Tax=Sphingomonas hominis TaxID=2741495 RepID=A0ABX2JSK8_9SPHN|nr:hypothetical protein [Sphingomonas hominis]NTS66793.1 hypothetical protein [Sphingomonas hominis]